MDLSNVHSGVTQAQARKSASAAASAAATARPLARQQGPVGQRRRQEAHVDLRRRPDAAVPPHPQARLQPCDLGQEYHVVNVGDLDAHFKDGDTVDQAALKRVGLANGPADGVRILGNGEVTKKLIVKAHHFSKSAAEKITAKGGTTEVIPPPKKPVRNKMKPPSPTKR